MAYSELIKNFEKVRAYMREFYVYGFKSRTEYDAKSARSYDDERRRLESWLGDYMHFTQTPEGKNVFLSVDSRVTRKNPFYKAWKAKSFTDGDITLHFAIFDILYDPKTKMTLTELIAEIDQRLSSSMAFDESTLRKKLKEYAEEGIIKHHYITQAMDSDVMATLFEAIHGHRYITVDNLGKHSNEVRTVRLVPLKLYISAQNGRQNLLAFHEKANRLNSYRLDYMSNIRIEDEICEKFDALRGALSKAEAHMWGVNCKWNIKHTEHVEFEIKIEDDEQFIVRRLEREKRCGCVEKIDDNHYRYVAEVFDTTEMLPWIRTFISRITRMSFSNRTAENKFKADIQEMCRMYGLDGGAAQ